MRCTLSKIATVDAVWDSGDAFAGAPKDEAAHIGSASLAAGNLHTSTPPTGSWAAEDQYFGSHPGLDWSFLASSLAG
jgi:hypothetical protein